ncbi:rho GTPase-activating protein 100F-like [Elysia marginata]|uniref:Rho GTPase-activating protein 100F-like n=1 Tax=Elysia marginata TaxID=1093978 RepID=A0AAV4ECS9_9GAST|nr:rho GTPase-activating protein 100F-like [Elysia marginata]
MILTIRITLCPSMKKSVSVAVWKTLPVEDLISQLSGSRGEEDPRNSEDPIKSATSGPSTHPQPEENRDADDSTRLLQFADSNAFTTTTNPATATSNQPLNTDSADAEDIVETSLSQAVGSDQSADVPQSDSNSKDPDPSDSEPLIPHGEPLAPLKDTTTAENPTHSVSSSDQPDKASSTSENAGTPRRRSKQKRPLSSPASIRHNIKSESHQLTGGHEAEASCGATESIKSINGNENNEASPSNYFPGAETVKPSQLATSNSPARVWGRSVSHEEPSRARRDKHFSESQQQDSASSGIHQHDAVLKELTTHSRFQSSEQRIHHIIQNRGHKQTGAPNALPELQQHQYLTEQQQLTLQRLRHQEEKHQKQRQQQKQRQSQQLQQQHLRQTQHREERTTKNVSYSSPPRHNQQEVRPQGRDHVDSSDASEIHIQQRQVLQPYSQYQHQDHHAHQQQQQRQPQQEGNFHLYQQYQLYQNEVQREQQQKHQLYLEQHPVRHPQDHGRFSQYSLYSHASRGYNSPQSTDPYHNDLTLQHPYRQQVLQKVYQEHSQEPIHQHQSFQAKSPHQQRQRHTSQERRHLQQQHHREEQQQQQQQLQQQQHYSHLQQQRYSHQHSQEQFLSQERLLLQQQLHHQQKQRGHDISHSSSVPSTFPQHQQDLPHSNITETTLQATRSFERGRPPTKNSLPLPAASLSSHTVHAASTPSSSSSSLIAVTKSLIPNNIGSYPSGDQHAVYANVRAPNGAAFGLGPVGLEMGIKSMEVEDDSFVVETVEIIKRPGQTLGFYIREGNGYDRSDGVFISRIQMGTVAQSNGLLHVGDEIVTVNNVQVGNMSLDDVVILMSIPKKLVLTIRTRRSSNKNKSCPALPVLPAERPEPPIVVLKKGRSSSASALEMTEKCPDLYEPGQSFAQYPLQSADYTPRRDMVVGSATSERRATSADRSGAGGTSPSSRYASIFISPGRAEAKLLSDDGMDSSNSSNEGSLPRSLASSKGGSEVRQGPNLSQQDIVGLGESPLHQQYQQHLQHYPGGYMSVTNPIYDQFPDRELRQPWQAGPDLAVGRRAGAMPKSPPRASHTQPSAATIVGGSSTVGIRGRQGVGLDVPLAYKEPPYMNIGAIREGLSQQQQGYQQHSHHHQHQVHPTLHSHHFPPSSQSHSYPFQSTSPQQQQQQFSLISQGMGGSAGDGLSQHYRGGMPLSLLPQEDRRGQERLRSLLSASSTPKARYGRLLRSRSPEGCYNSDSEIVFSRDHHHTQPQDGGRGFASDYETYGGAFSDDEPVYSIPRVPSSSSSELEMLLKKFTTLSQELQQEQTRLKRQLSSRDKGGGALPLTRAESLSGDEYVSSAVIGQVSPNPVRRAAATQTAGLQPRLSRHVSVDAPPSAASFLYGTSQHESHPDLAGRVGHGGMAISTSQTSAQLARQQHQGLLDDPSGSTASQAVSARLRDMHLTRKPLHIPYSEFEPYKVDMRKRVEMTRSGGLDGLLSVHIMSGQGLKSSKTSLRDLYCVVAVDSLNKARTMIRTGAINFDWDEAFDVDVEDSKEVSFLIYHWDPHFKHRLCFHGSILLPGYVVSSHKRHVAIKLEPKGILFVTLLYKEPAISLQRLPSVRKNALFGVELETVIVREASGLNVPRLVHKCVLEVERRGLETVGIYRLCGSARRKAMLRDAFQLDSARVDLSAENVSDIHVVTGVLKDYLRELPEPLFTNALYQMLLDALSVRLPCDPEGSAKLMLSILECLPSANQDTMALLLNHLRRIAAHSDKNKMGIDNLAICFGPVLLCPAPSSTPDPLLDFRKHIEVLRYLLEIWDYDGSSSTGTSKSPTVDTVVSMETGDSSLKTNSGQQVGQPDQNTRSLEVEGDGSRKAGDGTSMREASLPRH